VAIEREHGAVLILCDHCSDYVEGEDFDEAREAAASEGYKFDKTADGWGHTCATCLRNGDEKDGSGMPNEAW